MVQPSAIVHARGTAMLRSALGPAIAAWLDEPQVAEIMLNADGRLWVDRLDTGMAATEERLIAETIDVIAVLTGRGVDRRLSELVRVEGLATDGSYRILPLIPALGAAS